MHPYLVLSVDPYEKNYDHAVAVLHVPDHDPIERRNEPYESREASLLVDVADRLSLPIRRTYKSKAFNHHVELLAAQRHARWYGVPAKDFYKFA